MVALSRPSPRGGLGELLKEAEHCEMMLAVVDSLGSVNW